MTLKQFLKPDWKKSQFKILNLKFEIYLLLSHNLDLG